MMMMDIVEATTKYLYRVIPFLAPMPPNVVLIPETNRSITKLNDPTLISSRYQLLVVTVWQSTGVVSLHRLSPPSN